MRGPQLSSHSCQHICIFCANRLGGPSQPRTIQSSARSWKPAGAAATAQEHSSHESLPLSSHASLPSKSGWARSSFNTELTHEERRLKDQIKQTAAASNSSAPPEQTANYRDPSPLPRQGRPGLLFRPFPARDQDPTPRTNTIGGIALPEQKNAERSSRHFPSFNISTNRGRGAGNYDPNISQNWRHLRRYESKNDQGAATNDAPPQQARSPPILEDYEKFERDRGEREARSHRGDFVGFDNAGSKNLVRAVSSEIKWSIYKGVKLAPRTGESTSTTPGSALEASGDTQNYNGPTEIRLNALSRKGGDNQDKVLNPLTDKLETKRTWKPAFLSPDNPQQDSEGAQSSHAIINNVSPSDEAPPQTSLEEQDLTRSRRRSRERGAKEISPTTRINNMDGPSRGQERRRQRRRKEFNSEFDEEQDQASLRLERRKQRKKDRAAQKAAAPPVPIILPEFISINNLASILRVKPEQFIKKLDSLGFQNTNYDHVLNAETAGLIAMEHNYEPIVDKVGTEDLYPLPLPEDKSLLPQRPPIVTIMGHVDHGKTTLLDWLRKSSIAASEHGGITQHIGAFSVPMPSGKMITFLDTPGHAAFLNMRKRGADVTDIVILVVAADDSVKPQTIEAIKHAKAAKVPMIVAINKIDKGDANVEKVKQDLARHDVDVEDFGGDTQVVCVSGKTGQGMRDLEESAVTLSEVLDMRAEVDGQAEGWVLEATTKKAGRVATVLVRRGTLHQGDVIVAGSTWARVRTVKNEAGVEVASAGPGTPVEIDGWKEQPSAGDQVLQAPDEQKAKSVVAFRLERAEKSRLAADIEAVNDARRIEQEKRDREEQIAAGEEIEELEETKTGIKELFLIVKGDVSGSVEAVVDSISALGNEEVRPHILRSGVGVVSRFDVEHAAVAKGQIVSFNMPVDSNVSRLAVSLGVSIIDQNIIYRLVDDVKVKLSGMLAPLVTQRVVGEAEIAQIFQITLKGRLSKPIAGCMVRNGLITSNSKVRVLRDKDVIYDGTLASLKHVKKDVTEMRRGGECGMGFEDWGEFQVGDQVQCYEEKVEQRSL